MRSAVSALLFASFLCLAGSLPTARAQSCGDQTTQADTNGCFDRQYQQTDAMLNNTYRQVMARLRQDSEAARRLTAAQRAWLGFRDAECAFVAPSGEGAGSAQPMVLSQCLEALTRTRTAMLDAYLRCPEGDLSCPLPPP